MFLIALRDGGLIGACGLMQPTGQSPEIGYWLGAKFWGKGYATEAVRALIDHAFTDLDCEALQSAARVTNPASRRVLEKCGFQWTGAGLLRIRALNSSAPIDRFRLDRGLWASLKSWGRRRADWVSSAVPKICFGSAQNVIARTAVRVDTAASVRPRLSACHARRRGGRTQRNQDAEVAMTPPGQQSR